MKVKLTISVVFLVVLTLCCSQATSQSNKVETLRVSEDPAASPKESKSTTVETILEWNSKVAGRDFRWNGKDLSITYPRGKKINIFSDFAKSDFRYQRKENDLRNCLINYYYRPLTIVGSLVSFESETGLLCGATNTISWGYETFQLTNDGRFLFYRPNVRIPKSTNEPSDISLSDLFSHDSVFTSLLANERISKDIIRLLARRKIDKKPQNLAELKALFEKFEYDFLDGRFYLDALEGFAIHHLEGDNVCVWVSLLPKTHAIQAEREHLELLLPLPESLRESLLADSADQGFLMKDAEKYVGTSYAQFEFGSKK